MIVGVLIITGVGIVLLVIGLLIRNRQRADLLHDYHYRNVKPEDLPAYTRQVGAGLAVLGAALIAAGLLLPVRLWLCLAVMALGFAAGLAVVFRAQKKYNGGILS